MDFLLWAARSLHIFAVVVWLGGLMYQSAISIAVARAESVEMSDQTVHAFRRFVPFAWMSVWTILVTGIAMMLFDTRFVWFEARDRWSVLLLFKQLAFGLMVIFSFGFVRMFRRVEATAKKGKASGDDIVPYYNRMVQFVRINVGLGIIALLLAAGMR